VHISLLRTSIHDPTSHNRPSTTRVSDPPPTNTTAVMKIVSCSQRPASFAEKNKQRRCPRQKKEKAPVKGRKLRRVGSKLQPVTLARVDAVKQLYLGTQFLSDFHDVDGFHAKLEALVLVSTTCPSCLELATALLV